MTKELCPTDDKRFIQDSDSSWTNMNQTCCISAWESDASDQSGNIFPSKFGSWHHQIISPARIGINSGGTSLPLFSCLGAKEGTKLKFLYPYVRT